jgi:hypothetical protein
MFRIPETNLPDVAVEYEHDPADLVPLSHLALDLDAPFGGWDAALKTMGVDVLTDDIGRKAIARDDARRLIAEHREAEARQREAAERHDAVLEEQRRAQLHGGWSADQIPEGVNPVTWLLQTA